MILKNHLDLTGTWPSPAVAGRRPRRRAMAREGWTGTDEVVPWAVATGHTPSRRGLVGVLGDTLKRL